jgi:hypothetical protein
MSYSPLGGMARQITSSDRYLKSPNMTETGLATPKMKSTGPTGGTQSLLRAMLRTGAESQKPLKSGMPRGQGGKAAAAMRMLKTKHSIAKGSYTGNGSNILGQYTGMKPPSKVPNAAMLNVKNITKPKLPPKNGLI